MADCSVAVCPSAMSVVVVVCVAFWTSKGIFAALSKDFVPLSYVAAVVNASSEEIVATGAVVSPHWILTSAHLLPDDSKGVQAEDYYILAGHPVKRHNATRALTHPSYTWGLYTAEDYALFYVPRAVRAQPVRIAHGRFPLLITPCTFIYWNEYPLSNKERSVSWFKSNISIIQKCLMKKQQIPIGILEFYMQDLLCGTSREPKCVGETGGLLVCHGLLVGLLIRHNWCGNKTANFTDVGVYSNWLQSRVPDGLFVPVAVLEKFAGSVAVSPSVAVSAVVAAASATLYLTR